MGIDGATRLKNLEMINLFSVYCVLDMKIIGHRGAAGIAVENTLESIAVAMKHDIFAIEIDVRKTKDNHLVLMHDPITKRIADKNVTVNKSTLAELKQLRIKNNHRIASLDEALTLIGNEVPVIIDIKDTGLHQELVYALDRHPKVTVSFTGRKYDEMKKIFAARPGTAFFVQNHFSPIDVIQQARALGATGISLNMWLLNPLTYYLTRRYKLQLMVYTVNHAFIARFLKYLYPDILLCTNYPGKFKA
jgi:glycerophosphoryl diester phosphodiesterase